MADLCGTNNYLIASNYMTIRIPITAVSLGIYLWAA